MFLGVSAVPPTTACTVRPSSGHKYSRECCPFCFLAFRRFCRRPHVHLGLHMYLKQYRMLVFFFWGAFWSLSGSKCTFPVPNAPFRFQIHLSGSKFTFPVPSGLLRPQGHKNKTGRSPICSGVLLVAFSFQNAPFGCQT